MYNEDLRAGRHIVCHALASRFKALSVNINNRQPPAARRGSLLGRRPQPHALGLRRARVPDAKALVCAPGSLVGCQDASRGGVEQLGRRQAMEAVQGTQQLYSSKIPAATMQTKAGHEATAAQVWQQRLAQAALGGCEAQAAARATHTDTGAALRAGAVPVEVGSTRKLEIKSRARTTGHSQQLVEHKALAAAVRPNHNHRRDWRADASQHCDPFRRQLQLCFPCHRQHQGHPAAQRCSISRLFSLLLVCLLKKTREQAAHGLSAPSSTASGTSWTGRAPAAASAARASSAAGQPSLPRLPARVRFGTCPLLAGAIAACMQAGC